MPMEAESQEVPNAYVVSGGDRVVVMTIRLSQPFAATVISCVMPRFAESQVDAERNVVSEGGR